MKTILTRDVLHDILNSRSWELLYNVVAGVSHPYANYLRSKTQLSEGAKSYLKDLISHNDLGCIYFVPCRRMSDLSEDTISIAVSNYRSGTLYPITGHNESPKEKFLAKIDWYKISNNLVLISVSKISVEFHKAVFDNDFSDCYIINNENTCITFSKDSRTLFTLPRSTFTSDISINNAVLYDNFHRDYNQKLQKTIVSPNKSVNVYCGHTSAIIYRLYEEFVYIGFNHPMFKDSRPFPLIWPRTRIDYRRVEARGQYHMSIYDYYSHISLPNNKKLFNLCLATTLKKKGLDSNLIKAFIDENVTEEHFNLIFVTSKLS